MDLLSRTWDDTACISFESLVYGETVCMIFQCKEKLLKVCLDLRDWFVKSKLGMGFRRSKTKSTLVWSNGKGFM